MRTLKAITESGLHSGPCTITLNIACLASIDTLLSLPDINHSSIQRSSCSGFASAAAGLDSTSELLQHSDCLQLNCCRKQSIASRISCLKTKQSTKGRKLTLQLASSSSAASSCFSWQLSSSPWTLLPAICQLSPELSAHAPQICRLVYTHSCKAVQAKSLVSTLTLEVGPFGAVSRGLYCMLQQE